MNHKWMIAPLVLGIFLISLGSLIDLTSWYMREETRTLTFIEGILQIIGGLMLSTVSAAGAFIVEDKQARLGLLLFSALVTVFLLATKLPT